MQALPVQLYGWLNTCLSCHYKHNTTWYQRGTIPQYGSTPTSSSCVFTTGNTAEQWRRWEKQFAFYIAAAELTKKATNTQVAIVLHCAGPEAQDTYSNFVYVNNDDDRDTTREHVLAKFWGYCEPRKNEVHLKDINSGSIMTYRGRDYLVTTK